VTSDHSAASSDFGSSSSTDGAVEMAVAPVDFLFNWDKTSIVLSVAGALTVFLLMDSSADVSSLASVAVAASLSLAGWSMAAGRSHEVSCVTKL